MAHELKTASVLAFERKLDPSDALFFAGDWSTRSDSAGWAAVAIFNIDAELSAPIITRLGFSASNGQKRPAPHGRSNTSPGSPAMASAPRANCSSRLWDNRRARLS